MIGFALGAVVVLVAGYFLAKNHSRVREPAATVAGESILPDLSHPHPHSMRYRDDGSVHPDAWADDSREGDGGSDAGGDAAGDTGGDSGGDSGGGDGGSSD